MRNGVSTRLVGFSDFHLPALPRHPALALLVALCTLAVPALAEAARCTVTLQADGNTAAIQRQIDAKGRKPVVCLEPGHYKGARFVASRDFELRGVGEGRVVLDAGGRGRPLTVVSPGVKVTLANLTLTEGVVEQGGAVAVEADAAVRLEDCWVTRNKATRHGGAVYVREGQVELVRTRISANTAGSGSGLWAEDGGRLRVVSSLIHDNKSRGGSDDAAIVVRPGCGLELVASTLAYNPGHGVHVAPAGPSQTPAKLAVVSSVIMGAPAAISVDRYEAGEVLVTHSVLYGRTGFVPLDLLSRRELPVFDLESVERYRPTIGSPAIGIGLCSDRDARRDVAGDRRPRACTAGALESSPEAIRLTLQDRRRREAADKKAADEAEPDFWPEELR